MAGSEREVVVVAFDGVEVIDVAGPVSVFSAASRLLGKRKPGYRIVVAAPSAGLVRTSSAVLLHADRSLASLRGPVDTLLVAGRSALPMDAVPPELAVQIRRLSRRARRVASVCTGAFVLGAAGLLDERRATTHWAYCRKLQEQHRSSTVEGDPIFVRDGNVWTSAGATSGMDLCLALIEEDHGRELALEVARWLVLYLQRPGGQNQFSVPLAAQRAVRRPIRALETWILENLEQPLSVEELARRAKMSPRTFARTFRAETGTTPAQYVTRARLESARRWLETTAEPIAVIAERCGFARFETFDRAFVRAFGATPREYRRRFADRGASSRAAQPATRRSKASLTV
jgi:transcriptional regulator GlxA family with amidase domain